MWDFDSLTEIDLISISVNGLYGFLNHTMELKKEGITIIHGPNGCGKTTFLEIIKHFFDKNYDELVKYEFEEIIVKCNLEQEETVIDIKQIKIDLTNDFYKFSFDHINILDETEFKLSFFEFSWNGHIITTKPYLSYLDDSNSLTARIRPRIGKIEKNGEDILELIFEIDNERFRRIYDLDSLIHQSRKLSETFFKLENPGSLRPENQDEVKSFIFEKLISKHKFYMVNTQRLINIVGLNSRVWGRGEKLSSISRNSRDTLDSHLMIENHAKNLSVKISKSLAISTEKTQITDKSFPQRLIQIFASSDVDDVEVIRNKYKETEDKINRILKAGLLLREKNISLPTENFDNDHIKKVLQLYLQDLNEKLVPYEDILEKIETFQEIIGSKIKNKEMKINHEDGFYFISKVNDKKLKLRNLSSGEQHQIVLFFELIFLANSGTYYLIDEPEISLHVDWQRSFLDDIARVERLRGHKFIIATHSPQIIGSRRSLCVALDGGILNNE